MCLISVALHVFEKEALYRLGQACCGKSTAPLIAFSAVWHNGRVRKQLRPALIIVNTAVEIGHKSHPREGKPCAICVIFRNCGGCEDSKPPKIGNTCDAAFRWPA